MKKNFPLVVMCSIVIIGMSLGGCSKNNNTQTLTTLTNSITSATTTTQPLVALTISTNIKSGIGNYLVDGNGRTLYWTALDSAGQSNVAGAILANWPIFYSSNIVVPSSLNASDFGSITRADGTKQTTYKGRPLYYYINDLVAGDTFGQGINGIWFAVDPSLSGPTTITNSTISTTPATATTTIFTTTTSYPGY
jgi:predicted lipoprotein with Yx(FWY)xxD motif